MVNGKLAGKKIWFDIEEPKTGIMFKSLFDKCIEAGAKLLITARDYDSTFSIMDDLGYDFLKIGKHGGESSETNYKPILVMVALFMILRIMSSGEKNNIDSVICLHCNRSIRL